MIKKNKLVEKYQSLVASISNDSMIDYTYQIDLVHEIYNIGESGHWKLLSILLDRYSGSKFNVNIIDGVIFELLLQSTNSDIREKLDCTFKNGIVDLKSDYSIDYLPLQKLLLDKNFQQADILTQSLLCDLSRKSGQHSRAWLYFTDIRSLPVVDLKTIDKLWQIHSRGLFGLSVQKRIWLSTNANWERFWAKIGWKVDNVSCRYPQEFTWNMTAPQGHLPLFNQLRGVQVLAALFNHPAFYS
uniref:GUN4-like domain-containing protein n=1 Tax=Dermonema virens TaxID=1077399 RepID=A0A1G4NRH2_9FLOR|nr:Hypothetical protein ycf53 [Dermonema virens]SCW21263.1 Hypothetical protein ycf53 [Dermonema virens]